jgi:hypothetical protein
MGAVTTMAANVTSITTTVVANVGRPDDHGHRRGADGPDFRPDLM